MSLHRKSSAAAAWSGSSYPCSCGKQALNGSSFCARQHGTCTGTRWTECTLPARAGLTSHLMQALQGWSSRSSASQHWQWLLSMPYLSGLLAAPCMLCAALECKPAACNAEALAA